MKNLFILLFVLVSFFSCSKSDDNNQQTESRYPKSVNMRFTADPAITNDAIVSTSVGNDLNSHVLENETDYPFNFVALNQIVNLGTTTVIRYNDDTAISTGPTEPWVDYDVVLTIYVDDIEVITETITLTQQSPVAELEYTFL